MCCVLIVPSMYETRSTFSDFVFQSPLIRVWITTIIIFTILRTLQWKIVNSKEPVNQLVYISFNTIGLSFGSTSVAGVKSRSELITIFFLSVFGMLATETIQSITSLNDLCKYPQIESVLFLEFQKKLFYITLICKLLKYLHLI